MKLVPRITDNEYDKLPWFEETIENNDKKGKTKIVETKTKEGHIVYVKRTK